MRCMLCGRSAKFGGISTKSGVFLCYDHQNQPLCVWCDVPAVGSLSARPTCVTCRRSLVNSETQARSHIAALERFQHSIDVVPVKYDLHFRGDADTWAGGFTARQNPHLLGQTVYPDSSADRPQVEVALGMPRVTFMRVLAHEVAHVLLAPCAAARALPLRVQEGFSEVIGEAFASTSEDKYAVRRLKADIRTSTDPIYGRGYAEVSGRVRRVGLPQVIKDVTSGQW